MRAYTSGQACFTSSTCAASSFPENDGAPAVRRSQRTALATPYPMTLGKPRIACRTYGAPRESIQVNAGSTCRPSRSTATVVENVLETHTAVIVSDGTAPRRTNRPAAPQQRLPPVVRILLRAAAVEEADRRRRELEVDDLAARRDHRGLDARGAVVDGEDAVVAAWITALGSGSPRTAGRRGHCARHGELLD